MPFLCNSGKTEMGPMPYQPGLPSEMVTGEKAACPTTLSPATATSEMVSAFASRNALIITPPFDCCTDDSESSSRNL